MATFTSKNKIMQQKSYMNWQTSLCLAAFITLMFVLPLFSPLYLKMMGGEMFGFVSSSPQYISLLYNTGSFFGLTFLIFIYDFLILRSIYTTTKRNLYLIGGILLITLLFSTVQLMLYVCIFIPGNAGSFPPDIFGAIVLNNVSLALIVVFVSSIIYLSERRQHLALQYEALKTENMQIRYQALKNQVDPHFLFNTMSILDSLVDEDKQRTHEYIQRFSSVYRYILQTKETVTLDEELRFMDDYFGLLQVRYGECLQFKTEINSAFKNYPVVPLSLQILIENAVKHNIISQQHPLRITVRTTNDCELIVCNNYQPKSMPSAGAGIGLTNLSERYMLKWQKDITIEQTEEEFKVTLPLVFKSTKPV
ncbi:sensor histidine kinase [Bacteroides sp. MSB163]|uniref:sensor histidine kinase n=1 Tax=Bacteroides maternus TaxID=3117552 RepID=UPI002ED83032